MYRLDYFLIIGYVPLPQVRLHINLTMNCALILYPNNGECTKPKVLFCNKGNT